MSRGRSNMRRGLASAGKVFFCPRCNKRLGSEQAVQQHVEAKHARPAPTDAEVVTQSAAPVLEPPVCPYCDGPAQLFQDSSLIYNGRNYGPLWVCEACQAWVGCHPGTITPLGRLADQELRRAKMAAHDAFDRLWRAKMRREGCSQRMARASAYAWLAQQLGRDPLYTHIGLFDVPTCQRVVELCRPFHAENRERAA